MSKTQDRLDSFYGIDNLVTVDITMPAEEWESLMACEPRGGICNFDYVGGPRFDWYSASFVTISGTKLPQPQTFADVGIIKKSYCGSFSTTKPSVRLDFSRNVPANEDVIEKLIGTKSITLNNCKQDPSFVRQPLGYELFRQAGVPYARSNFAKLIVNGVDMGVFVNLEQYKKQFLKNNFAGNDNGNLYELDAGDDLDAAVIRAGKISFESGVTDNQKDLLVAADTIATGGLEAAKKVVDYDAFVRLFAMETLLKHRDGFTINTNNTYLYNDVKAVKDPTVKNVKLKFIPCGLDQILREKKDFEIGCTAILARLIREDTAGRADLSSVIQTFATTIFSKSNHDTVLKPYVDRLEALVAKLGAQPAEEISSLRHEMSLIRSGAFQHLHKFPSEAVTFLARVRGDCFFARAPSSGPQEVYHDQPSPTPSCLWLAVPVESSTDTIKLQNQAYGSWLHAAAAVAAKRRGNPAVYASPSDTDPGCEFVVEPTVSAFGTAPWFMTGYFRLKSKVTGKYVLFSEADVTGDGKKAVVQGGAEAATVFYIF
ncbi:cellulosomal protein [Marssonina coronariae]|uniref:Cellulosomal protein n=1 Tax=Diplocarpon coronariae TaxID=2795749 RepID=A0A218Z9B8_9HELO|nr:cellulosomal protein [Marssonina coronariae]